MLGLFWFIVGGALGLSFWGVVLAFILKWGKKLDRLPRWPIAAGLVVGGIVGAFQYASY